MYPVFPLLKPYFSGAKKALAIIIVFSSLAIAFNYIFIQRRPLIDNRAIITSNREAIYSEIKERTKDTSQQSKTTIGVYRFFMCSFIGEACTNSPNDGDKNFGSSIFGLTSKLIILPYQNPPASGVYWAYAGLQNSGFIPKSYAAQGIGFASLQPLSTLWRLFRDLTYFLIVIFIVIVGFLIMFRFKINAQTVASLENSIPRIFVTLVLITFSFPIAGFLIDLMYLITAVMINVLAGNGIFPINAAEYQNLLFSGHGAGLFDLVFLNGNYWGVGQALFSILPASIETMIRILLSSVGFLFIWKLMPSISNLVGGDFLKGLLETGGIPSTILAGIMAYLIIPIIYSFVPILLSLVVFLTGLFIFFRIFFQLFKAYIQIILLVIFAPVMLLFHAIPGQKVFSKWIKDLLANLLTFPIVISLMIVSSIVVSIGNAGHHLAMPINRVGENLWRPPLLTGTSETGFSVLVGVGILFIIPEVLKSIKGFLGLKPSPIQPGVGMFFGGVGAVGGQATHGLGKFHQIGMSAGMIGRFAGDNAVGKFFSKLDPYARH